MEESVNRMYRKFPRKLYGSRAKIETGFSIIKRKLSAKAPGRTLPMQSGKRCYWAWPFTCTA